MAYGRQFQTTRNDPRLRPDYTAALNQKLKYLPARLQQQQNEQQHQDDLAFRERTFAQSSSQFKDSQQLRRRQMEQTERAQEAGMGLEAAKAGMGMAMKGGMNLKDKLGSMPAFGSGGGGATAPSGWTPGTGTGTGGVAKGGLFSQLGSMAGKAGNFLKDSASKYLGGLTMGNSIGAGLTGFGAGRLLGGDNKLKKFGLGAAAGGLMSLFGGGGSGSGGSDFITGSLFGGIGGLF